MADEKDDEGTDKPNDSGNFIKDVMDDAADASPLVLIDVIAPPPDDDKAQ